MRTTIEMAREAAGAASDWALFREFMPEIHKLAELVRADERARMAEQPAQHEPFTHYRHYDNGLQDWADEKTIPLYTFPPAQRTWVGLTDEEIERIFNNWPTYHLDHEEFARAIEAKLKQRNT